MSRFNIQHNLCLFLVISSIACSHSSAEQPPQIFTSYIPDYVQLHHFTCKNFDGEFLLRSTPPTKPGRLKVQFVSAKFNGRMIDVSPKIHDAFETILYTETIFGECSEQNSTVGVVISAATNVKNLPDMRLYFDLTPSGVKFYELVCETEAEISELPDKIAEMCTIER